MATDAESIDTRLAPKGLVFSFSAGLLLQGFLYVGVKKCSEPQTQRGPRCQYINQGFQKHCLRLEQVFVN